LATWIEDLSDLDGWIAGDVLVVCVGEFWSQTCSET